MFREDWNSRAYILLHCFRVVSKHQRINNPARQIVSYLLDAETITEYTNISCFLKNGYQPHSSICLFLKGQLSALSSHWSREVQLYTTLPSQVERLFPQIELMSSRLQGRNLTAVRSEAHPELIFFCSYSSKKKADTTPTIKGYKIWAQEIWKS